MNSNLNELYKGYLKNRHIALGQLAANDLEKALELFLDVRNSIQDLKEADEEENYQARFDRMDSDNDEIIEIIEKVLAKNKDKNEIQNLLSSKVCLDDIVGLESVKEDIKRSIIYPKKYQEIYRKFNKRDISGILLYGVPGTGKTMLAKAIATELNCPFYQVKCSDIASRWYGESEKNIKAIFDEARKNAPSVIFFDEFEAIGMSRSNESVATKLVVAELLNQLSGDINEKKQVLVLAATNRPWDIDSALLRPGRFDSILYVDLPDDKARKALIEREFDFLPCDKKLDIKQIVDFTNQFSPADILSLINKIKDSAIAKSIEAGKIVPITNQDILDAEKDMHSSISTIELNKFVKYRKLFDRAV